MLARTCFGKESVKRIVATSNGLVTGHLTIRLTAVLKAKELPASISDLNASLAKVEHETFTHGDLRRG
jgi:hypothetical protein